ncbi:phosphonate ABC transporter substrate-binding protein [Methylobacterium sp. Leaf361]|uniref:substrate-binding domain-containing protein n=1 Tax=Methylobacterium sp. Leaf361 TaxID=1736352 RepID=UPI0006FD3069|nr:PhnD/SsuA/transferrin family substrate-binding protein [Methylobacterium sp. Leaf361]KQS85303.1 phosphonate ABC transporter substrate-binding protein [Methylobacterium sp. Leaf361]
MRPQTPSRRAFLPAAAALATVPLHARASTLGPDAFRFGLTPVCLTSDLELLARLQGYLERALNRPVRLVTRRTYQEITALLISGELDAAWICGFPFVAYQPRLALAAVPVWRGRPLYRSYLITSSGRNAERLPDLQGDIHAFSDPDSNSGWLVTAAELATGGSSPDRFFRRTFFTWGHRNVVRAVASGLADSGSVDGYVYEVMRETDPALVARTRIVRASEWLPFPPLAIAAGAAASDKAARFRDALSAMTGDAEGRAVLAMLRLDGFRQEDAGLYDPIARKIALVRGLPG